MPSFVPKTAAVVGLGKSGRAAIELLTGLGAKVRAFEENAASNDVAAVRKRGIEVTLGELREGFWRGCEAVIVSPGVPLSKPVLLNARRDGAVVMGEVELAYRCLPPGAGPVLAVTGTNGKSTTTALLGELVAQSGAKTFVGGNLGRPFSEACAKTYQAHVVELSSFQLEGTLNAEFLGAAVLNLTPDHLDRYPSHRAYGEAKGRIFRNPIQGSFGVVNADDVEVVRLARTADRPMYAFTLDGSAPHQGFAGMAAPHPGGFRFLFGGREALTIQNRALRGAHNLQNAMAAGLMARLFGATAEAIQEGLNRFAGLPHRLELVRELDGVEWVNDSKATNVDSSLVALRAFDTRVWLIAGGKGKGAPYAPLVDAAHNRVAGVLTIGQDASAIAQAFSGFEVHACETLQGAVAKARGLAKSGDVVLLSPACASYDQFDNFEHRGDTFKRLVGAL